MIILGKGRITNINVSMTYYDDDRHDSWVFQFMIALQYLCTPWRKSDVKEPKDEDAAKDEETDVKEDPDSPGDSDDKEDAKEGADIRDIRYNLEKLSLIKYRGACTYIYIYNPINMPRSRTKYEWLVFQVFVTFNHEITNGAPARCLRKELSAKDRSLSVRNITWVFSKEILTKNKIYCILHHIMIDGLPMIDFYIIIL